MVHHREAQLCGAARLGNSLTWMVTPMHVTMLLYPRLTQLDLTGPFEVLARVPELSIQLVWKEQTAIVDASGLRLFATHAFHDAPPTDILFVPGGPGQLALMDDTETLTYLRQRAKQAQFVTSVCTGSLVLAAAGLLQGYQATCHWMSLPQLALMGSVPVQERVVIDRNRITGAGVTSGIDFGLTLVATIFGKERAQLIQLSMEYDPQPPFAGGSVATAEPMHVEQLKAQATAFQERRELAARLAGEAIKSG